jgi:prevent-host-death family protein
VKLPVSDVKRRLGAVVAAVDRGREVTITRRGVAVARLVPIAPGFDRGKARRAAEGLRQASRGIKLNGLGLKDLVDEGRLGR